MSEQATKPTTPWKKARGPIIASPWMVELAAAINAHLTAPIGVLPVSTDGIIRPFAIGLGTEIEARIKPDAAVDELQMAVRQYARNRIYMLAMAQPNAMRHDIDGNPVEPVSEANRMSAQVKFTRLQDAIEKRRKEREQEEAQAAA